MKWSRRSFLKSLSATVLLSKATAAHAACDVSRSRVGELPSKSYFCNLGNQKEVTVTFLRLSDIMFDVSRLTNAPSWMPQSVNSIRILPSKTLDTLNDLYSRYSKAVERSRLGFEYASALGDELRDSPELIDGPDGFGRNDVDTQPIRSLGVWEHTWSAPTFPLHAELEAATWISENGPNELEFLRFANRGDFQGLDEGSKIYRRLLQSRYPSFGSDGDLLDLFDLGNLALLQYVNAGSVEGFVPIFGSNKGGCGGFDNVGILFDPPALFVDVAVFENSGSAPLVIDEILGEVDDRDALRPYSSATATDLQPLGHEATSLAPGESVMLVQRLLFRSLQQQLPDVQANRAVYGTTALPTGVVVDGQVIPFDGRSHNSLLLVSYLPDTCCPFLEYWCADREEWVSLGNVIGGAEGKSNMRTDVLALGGFVGRFRLSEHEAEMSCIRDVHLDLELEDGRRVRMSPEGTRLPIRIDFLENVSLVFDLPKGINAADVKTTQISITGYYAKFHSCERRQMYSDAVSVSSGVTLNA